jgi:carbonic anhydrase/acetyltransferase-like protein (isoleucine patch superfamily)
MTMWLAFAKSFLGDLAGMALFETGQALQRTGLRAQGMRVVPPFPFHFVGKKSPFIVTGSDIHPSAVVTGDATVYAWARVGRGSVLRAESNEINVGLSAVVGNNCVITAGNKSVNGLPATVEIGMEAKIGDNCVLESCIVGNRAVVGEGCVVSEGSIVENDSVLEPGSVVPPLHRIPAHQVWGGVPARFKSEIHKH